MAEAKENLNQADCAGNVVLCGSNGYEKSYYFNEKFQNLPQDIQDQLRIMSVWFTEEIGGILTMEFTPEGKLEFLHRTAEYDGFYDEIGADLKMKQFIREGQQLLESLETYYQVFFLGKAGEGLHVVMEKRNEEV